MKQFLLTLLSIALVLWCGYGCVRNANKRIEIKEKQMYMRACGIVEARLERSDYPPIEECTWDGKDGTVVYKMNIDGDEVQVMFFLHEDGIENGSLSYRGKIYNAE